MKNETPLQGTEVETRLRSKVEKVGKKESIIIGMTRIFQYLGE